MKNTTNSLNSATIIPVVGEQEREGSKCCRLAGSRDHLRDRFEYAWGQLQIVRPAPARLPSLNMPPKRPAMSPGIAKKIRKSLTLEVKLDIIQT
ncbi:hypothetical protein E2C01_065376 [Portunus trituberculatus]|uniref:Uncharacterized protein n=1 Tax=Portunus trituberculatus TaxID=210409 RepID=A0A5B7HPE5_PORTR|nr:hypothetical protein [Portunus trituberculatus]